MKPRQQDAELKTGHDLHTVIHMLLISTKCFSVDILVKDDFKLLYYYMIYTWSTALSFCSLNSEQMQCKMSGTHMRFVKHFFPLDDHRYCRNFLRTNLKLLFQTEILQVFFSKISYVNTCLEIGQIQNLQSEQLIHKLNLPHLQLTFCITKSGGKFQN